MSPHTTRKTPGVYINEVNSFGNSVTPVPTAIPAFIGYTPQAEYDGKSYTNVAIKITSLTEFQSFFCHPNPENPSDATKQYNPQYYVTAEKNQPEKGDYIVVGDMYYAIAPDPNTIYYLYNSIRLFYENGGGDAYIVSVGGYDAPSGKPIPTGDQITNQNIQLNALLGGLTLLKKEQEPTMYICPEATLLSVANNGTLMEAMLLQCTEMKTAISIFDVIGGNNPEPINYLDAIKSFRNNTGNKGLNYGTAYYPFVGTTIMQASDINYTNLFGGDTKQLKSLLSPASKPNTKAETILSNIENPPSTPLTISQNNKALIAASKTYSILINKVLSNANMLPPSGGMAGVIARTDNQTGPWKAPANISMIGAASLPIRLTDTQQADLNIDPASGKSVNAIRYFNGQGILIWGARTLDGNNQDWRYISVRRTMTFLEQSSKLAAQAYVFEPNNANTWAAIKAMIENFLTNIWQQGGLLGTSPADAFIVECGLGSTMTSNDILDGIMKIKVKVAVVHPAEFVVFTFQQQMASA